MQQRGDKVIIGNILKSFGVDNDIEKGKAEQPGTIKTWGKKKYQKQPDGSWKPVSEKKGGGSTGDFEIGTTVVDVDNPQIKAVIEEVKGDEVTVHFKNGDGYQTVKKSEFSKLFKKKERAISLEDDLGGTDKADAAKMLSSAQKGLKQGIISKEDLIDLTYVADHYGKGDMKGAKDMADELDTAVRDFISPHMWEKMGGGLTEVKKPKEKKEIADEDNPRFTYQNTNTSILTQIAKGQLDPVEMAKRELANRGLDSNGKWIGFDKAKEHHFGPTSWGAPKIKEEISKVMEKTIDRKTKYEALEGILKDVPKKNVPEALDMIEGMVTSKFSDKDIRRGNWITELNNYRENYTDWDRYGLGGPTQEQVFIKAKEAKTEVAIHAAVKEMLKNVRPKEVDSVKEDIHDYLSDYFEENNIEFGTPEYNKIDNLWTKVLNQY